MRRLMQIAAPGQSGRGVGFDDPLGMLAACHRRVEQQCDTLRRLVPHLAAHGSDATARDAADAVLRYFGTAAVHHHADEEDDLFPAMLESVGGFDAICLRELTARLLADHDALQARWRDLRRLRSRRSPESASRPCPALPATHQWPAVRCVRSAG